MPSFPCLPFPAFKSPDIDQKWKRIGNIQKEIKNLSMSEFVVGDLKALSRIMWPTSLNDIEEKYLLRLERRIKKIRSKKRG